jgi:regulation of enolase protein 1 (concanavalin A-like superfamily)
MSKDFWLKTSVEYEHETLSRLGVVVTNFGYSDWSTQDFNPNNNEIELRVSKHGMDYLVEFKLEEAPWSQMRMAHLHGQDEIVQCGLYACSPIDTGYTAEFDFLEVAVSS